MAADRAEIDGGFGAGGDAGEAAGAAGASDEAA
jgi:hypothetical protein